MYCYLPVFLCLFESFRKDLNRIQGGLPFEYYLILLLLSEGSLFSGGRYIWDLLAATMF